VTVCDVDSVKTLLESMHLLRPNLGSRAMLMFGPKPVSPILNGFPGENLLAPMLRSARISVAMTEPLSLQLLRLNEAPSPTGPEAAMRQAVQQSRRECTVTWKGCSAGAWRGTTRCYVCVGLHQPPVGTDVLAFNRRGGVAARITCHKSREQRQVRPTQVTAHQNQSPER
jgi:hypothetical protein